MRKKQDNTMLAALLPPPQDACQFCWNDKQGVYSSIPVYLVEPSGNWVELGFRSQCPCCGHVKRYDNGVLYRLNGKVADFKAQHWPEVRQWNLDANALNNLVSTAKTRYFEVNNLPKYQSPRHRADFFEPKAERCEMYA